MSAYFNHVYKLAPVLPLSPLNAIEYEKYLVKVFPSTVNTIGIAFDAVVKLVVVVNLIVVSAVVLPLLLTVALKPFTVVETVVFPDTDFPSIDVIVTADFVVFL